MGKTTPEWNKISYENRKSRGLWLNQKQRLLIEKGPAWAQAYEAWSGMKTRCKADTIKNACYLGVKVCDRWIKSFDDFVADVGLPQKGLSLDRINSLGNYDPENCRWTDIKTQARNTVKSKITLLDAENIRKMYAEENVSQQKIADRFGILQVSVSQIVLNKIWVP